MELSPDATVTFNDSELMGRMDMVDSVLVDWVWVDWLYCFEFIFFVFVRNSFYLSTLKHPLMIERINQLYKKALRTGRILLRVREGLDIRVDMHP